MRDIQRAMAVVIGAVLTLLALAGFFTGPQVLGFGSNALLDTVHLVTGLLGILAFTQGGAAATTVTRASSTWW